LLPSRSDFARRELDISDAIIVANFACCSRAFASFGENRKRQWQSFDIAIAPRILCDRGSTSAPSISSKCGARDAKGEGSSYGVFLSDGTISLAILRFGWDQGPGLDFRGIHHLASWSRTWTAIRKSSKS
jgi:hypothetical protein